MSQTPHVPLLSMSNSCCFTFYKGLPQYDKYLSNSKVAKVCGTPEYHSLARLAWSHCLPQQTECDTGLLGIIIGGTEQSCQISVERQITGSPPRQMCLLASRHMTSCDAHTRRPIISPRRGSTRRKPDWGHWRASPWEEWGASPH